MALPEVGKYLAKLDGPAVLHDRENETPPKTGLQVFFPCIVVADGPEKGKTITAVTTLVDKNGAVQVNTWTKFRKIFGQFSEPGDMFDPSQNHSEKEFEIDVQDETYEGQTRRKVKWINVPGESGGMNMPAPADKRSVLAKYGNQFRALSGGAPAVKAAPAAPKAPARPPTPPAAAVPTCTIEQAWAALCENRPGATQDQLTSDWFKKLDEIAPGKQPDQLTPADWGRVRAELVKDHSVPA